MTPRAESLPAAVHGDDGSTLFRNSRLFLAFILLLGILFGIFSLGALALTLSAAGELLPLSADSVYTVLASALMTLSFTQMSLWLVRQSRLMANNHARLDARGIEFSYGSKRSPRKMFLSWAEITVVYNWRLPQGQAYRVETSADNYAEFSSYTFFRPKKLATLIAKRTGRPIQRVTK